MPAPIFTDPTSTPSRRPRLDPRQVRDLLSILLIVVGVVGLVVTAWAWHPLAGLAVMFAATFGLGVFLGLDW